MDLKRYGFNVKQTGDYSYNYQYREVLASKPQPCPVGLWTEMIMGPQADFEYHLFKKWGFDVPLSAQRAFFTMMMGPRSSYLKNNDELARIQSIINLAKG